MNHKKPRPYSVRTEVNKRIKLLNLANKLESVSQACLVMKISRTQFYEYKKRFETLGIEGLKPINKGIGSRKQRIPTDLSNKIIAISLEEPSLSAKPIEAVLSAGGFKLSSISIQKVLRKNELSTKLDRWLFIENKLKNDQTFLLNPSQEAFLHKMNPNHKERNMIGLKPGQILIQDCVHLMLLPNGEKVYCYFVKDTYSGLVFNRLALSKDFAHVIELLRGSVIPFFRRKGLKIENLITHSFRALKGDHSTYFLDFLTTNGIAHNTTNEKENHSNGFAERYIFELTKEFSSELKFKNLAPLNMDVFVEECEKWVNYYNKKRSYFGFPNFGSTPLVKFENWFAGKNALLMTE